MNKEALLDCYFNEICYPKKISSLLKNFPNLFQHTKSLPENLFPLNSNDSLSSSKVSEESSAYETLSFQSDSSLLTVDQTVIQDVLDNKWDHKPFSNLDQSFASTQNWEYLSKKNQIIHGGSSQNMDKLFHLGEFNASTQVKTSSMQDFKSFRFLLKKYCKYYRHVHLMKGANLIDCEEISDSSRDNEINGKIKVKALRSIGNFREAKELTRQRARTNSTSCDKVRRKIMGGVSKQIRHLKEI